MARGEVRDRLLRAGMVHAAAGDDEGTAGALAAASRLPRAARGPDAAARCRARARRRSTRGSRKPRPARPAAARSSPGRNRPGPAAPRWPAAATVSNCSGRVMRSQYRDTGPQAIVGGDGRVAEVLDLLQDRVRLAAREGVARQQQDGQAVRVRERSGRHEVGRARADRGGAGHHAPATVGLGEGDRRVCHRLLVVRAERRQGLAMGRERLADARDVAVSEDREHAVEERLVAARPVGSSAAARCRTRAWAIVRSQARSCGRSRRRCRRAAAAPGSARA